jgi:class 3 adenylate cyclase
VILLGSTLNFASRLEGLAEKDEIIVSRQLKNIVERKYKFTTIPEEEIERRMKGKIKSFEGENVVYAVEGKIAEEQSILSES